LNETRVTLWNPQGLVIYNGKVDFLPVPDSIISKKAFEYYFTEKLCCTRRAALKSRLISELEQAMTAAGGQYSRINWLSLPEEIRSCFSFDKDVKWFMLY
jgi:hypothetical protein